MQQFLRSVMDAIPKCAVLALLAIPVRPALAAPSASDKSGSSLKTKIGNGNDALAAQNFDDACKSFSDALTIDPRNNIATRGLGLAYAGLKDYAKAAPLLDKAVAENPNDRSVVYNAAAVHVDANAAMRGAKILKDYLQAHPTAADEPMGNALAIAIGQADEQARKNSFYQTATAFYKTYSAKLEAASPGMKRWGIEWISASDYTDKLSDIKSKQTDLDEANKKLADCNDKLASLKARLPSIQQGVQSGVETQNTLDDLNSKISNQQDQQTKLTADRDAVVASIPQPSLPATLDYVASDAMPAPAILGQAVADNSTPQIAQQTPDSKSATPSPTDGTTTDQPADDTSRRAPPKPAMVVQFAAAFPIAPDLLITAASPLGSGAKIELLNADGNPMPAVVVRTDVATGLALLRLTQQKMSYLSLADHFSGGPIQCSAFPKVNMFNPTVEMLSGTAPASTTGWKVTLNKHPHIPGAPLLVDGKVVGVEIADRDALENELPAVTLTQLKAFLGADLPATPGNASAASVMLQLSATKIGGGTQ